MNLFIIPGNPPALHFYERWAEEIQRECKNCSVYVSPYQRLPFNRDSFAYLSRTSACHGRELAAFHESVKTKVTIIGHSLGAWMALRLLEEYNPIVDSCLLLYPFLRKPSLKGRAILRFMRHLYQIPFSGHFLLRCRAALERLSDDVKYVSDEELRISLALSYHEHKVIARHKEALQIPEHLRKKLHMIYCDQDKWCPPEAIHEMKQLISCEKLEMSHGFITSAQERREVLKALLQKFILEKESQGNILPIFS